MYHQSIIDKNLVALEPTYVFRGHRYKFKLQEFGINEIDQYVNALNEYVNSELWKQKQRVEFTKNEITGAMPEIPEPLVKWMANERYLCMNNWRYFAERYYKVSKAETNKFIKFQFNRTACIFLDILADQQLQLKAVRILQPKARQIGASTFWAGICQHRLQFFSEIKAILASYEKKPTDKLSGMITSSMERQPWWLAPEMKRLQTGEFFIWMNDSRLDLGWGTQDTLGTGSTPTVALLSEVAKYRPNPELAIDAGLINCMHESPESILVLESTAEERDDYWHDLIKSVIKGEQIGSTSFIISFIPWFIRDDLYPTETWLHGRGRLYETFSPSIETLAYARSAEATVRANHYFRKYLGSNWTMPREQLFYYQIRKQEAIGKNKLHLFLREMPSNLEEAFQHAGSIIYPIKVINDIEIAATTQIPYVYKLRGDANEINPDLFPIDEEIDYTGKKATISISARYDRSLPSFNFELVPVIFEGWDRFDYQGKILIWEHPIKNVEYGIGVDTSDGLGKDDAAIEGLRKGTIAYKDKQVFEFASNLIASADMWPYIMALGRYYSQYNDQQLLTIETGKGGGGPLITEMRNRGWWNFFKQMSLDRIGEDLSTKHNYGWMTTARTRPVMVELLNSFIINRHMEIGSIPLISELKGLREKPMNSYELGARKYKIQGKKDNRYMAIGICLASLHQDEILGHTMKSWDKRRELDNEVKEFEVFSPDKYMSQFTNRDQSLILGSGEEQWAVKTIGEAYQEEGF